MPTYAFRCEQGCRYDAVYPMAQVPAGGECRECGAPAKRLLTPPNLSRSGSSAYRLIDGAARSAHDPAVVTATAPGTRSVSARTSNNPLHKKLPRP